MTDIHLLPEEDGNLMSITNELIREGWELTRIESLEKYKEISTLFDDDREDAEFTMKAVSKNIKGKYKETTVKTFGKDYSEARKNAIKNNPTMIIYG